MPVSIYYCRVIGLNIYGAYKNVRHSVWNFLIDFKISALPVDLKQIAKLADIQILQNADVHILTPSQSGCSLFGRGKWFIVFDESDSIRRRRFTIAHEFGHIFLGHELKEGYRHTRTFAEDKPQYETEADIFASQLLMPACVLWGLNLHTAGEIAEVCNVSLTAAQIRADRMKELYARNMFGTHPLERRVMEQFKPYIISKNPEAEHF